MSVDFIRPYEGTNEYIFISYSHRNIPLVYDIMKKLDSAGFRMWYDKGIPLTSDYANDIARHIANCTVVVIFHSPESASSDFCQNEIHLACDLQKPILQVFLQQTTLAAGIQLRLNRYQSINFYDYVNAKSLNEFYRKIFSTKVLQPCRNKNNLETIHLLGEQCTHDYKKETDPIKKADLRKKAIYYLQKLMDNNWVFKDFIKSDFEYLIKTDLYEINEQTENKVYQHALTYLDDYLHTSNFIERYFKLYDAKWILQKIASNSSLSLKESAKEKLDAIKTEETIKNATFQELLSRPQNYGKKH